MTRWRPLLLAVALILGVSLTTAAACNPGNQAPISGMGARI